jgi:diguanylate cyclase (GGDEF)-like protein
MNDLYDKVKEKLWILDNMYDVMRIIDPINKNVISISNQQGAVSSRKCYDILNRGEMCENCISVRVEVEKDTFIKLEYVTNGVMLIIATSISFDGERYIVEIIKNITAQKNKILHDEFHSHVKDVIDNLNEKIIKDENTSVYNRLYIESRLPVDLNNCIVNENNLSIIMIEIDHFKSVNDECGQDLWTEFLIDISEIISKTIKGESYWIGRYSENKYIIVLNNIDKKEAYNISDEIKDLLKDISYEYNNEIVKFNVNLGVYCSGKEKIDIKNILADLEGIISEEKQKRVEKISKEQ